MQVYINKKVCVIRKNGWICGPIYSSLTPFVTLRNKKHFTANFFWHYFFQFWSPLVTRVSYMTIEQRHCVCVLDIQQICCLLQITHAATIDLKKNKQINFSGTKGLAILNKQNTISKSEYTMQNS